MIKRKVIRREMTKDFDGTKRKLYTCKNCDHRLLEHWAIDYEPASPEEDYYANIEFECDICKKKCDRKWANFFLEEEFAHIIRVARLRDDEDYET